MAKSKKKGNGKRGRETESSEEKPAWHTGIHEETKRVISAIAVFVLAALLLLSYHGKGGAAGRGIFWVLDLALGKGYFFAPLALFFVGVSFLFAHARRFLGATALGGALFLFSSLGLLNILFGAGIGGVLGSIISRPLLGLFDFWAGLIIAGSVFAVSLLLTFNIPIRLWREEPETPEMQTSQMPPVEQENPVVEEASNGQTVLGRVEALIASAVGGKGGSEASSPAASVPQNSAERQGPAAPAAENEGGNSLIQIRQSALRRFRYKPPGLELLQGDQGKPNSGDIRANANIIKRTLENFGIIVEMGEVSIGPTVTQYTLRPAEGVKLSKIVALHSNLSLALAAHPIRIEAPIPGKSLVGIEVPNRSIALVGLRALLDQKIFHDSLQPLLISLGRDVTGLPVFADLARMPHLLISGATGSGKSVSIHTLVGSLLYRNGPQSLRFILVDPKRVELSVYNDIPHLLTPVITDPKKTIQALRWATKEMDRRYDLLSAAQVRDIISFNSSIGKESDQEPLPYIVIIIDELADLMAVFPREVESSIIRIAQMARAVGIHLIVATQRPSVEVITGLIKANITSRIAFQVASQVDSRTILDSAGAEKLLGNGDMLFLAGDSGRPRRIQGAYVSEQEVRRIVEFLRDEVPAPEYEYEEEMFSAKGAENGEDTGPADWGDDDPLYGEAQALVVDAGKASASYLQRRLRVGYARAARLLDILESKGVIGPADGAKPREIRIGVKNDPSADVLES